MTRVWFAARDISTVEAQRRPDNSFTATLPGSLGTEETVAWRVLALTGSEELSVFAPSGFESPNDPNAAGLRATANRQGQAVVNAYPGAAIVSVASCNDRDEIEVSGALYGLAEVEVGLGPMTGTAIAWHRATVDQGRFAARVVTSSVDHAGVTRPLPSGRYVLHARRPGDEAGSLPVLLSERTPSTCRRLGWQRR